jgi:hypothetical protein
MPTVKTRANGTSRQQAAEEYDAAEQEKQREEAAAKAAKEKAEKEKAKLQAAALKRGKRQPAPKREILYPNVDTLRCLGNKVLTLARAKEIMGWQEEVKNEDGTLHIDFGSDYLFINPVTKLKVRCLNNTRNRPFVLPAAERYSQDMLKRIWADSRNGKWLNDPEPTVNGETIILGKTALVLSGQHRLIGFIIACMRWEVEGYWKTHYWPDMPTLECLVSVGVSEDPHTVRTIDNVLTRTDADVMYTEGYFSNHPPAIRKALCGVFAKAVRFLWERARDEGEQSSARSRTIGEVMAWAERHKNLTQIVERVHQEDTEKAVRHFLQTGQMSGLIYLLAASHTDPRKYHTVEFPSERQIIWGPKGGKDETRWDEADAFLVQLSSCKTNPDSHFKILRDLKCPQVGDRKIQGRVKCTANVFGEKGVNDVDYRLAAIIKAWNVWLSRPKTFPNTKVENAWWAAHLTRKEIAVELKEDSIAFDKDAEGFEALTADPKLDDWPTVGGIDVGSGNAPRRKESEAEAEAGAEGDGEGEAKDGDGKDESPDEDTAANKRKEREALLRQKHAERQKNGEAGKADSEEEEEVEEVEEQADDDEDDAVDRDEEE